MLGNKLPKDSHIDQKNAAVMDCVVVSKTSSQVAKSPMTVPLPGDGGSRSRISGQQGIAGLGELFIAQIA